MSVPLIGVWPAGWMIIFPLETPSRIHSAGRNVALAAQIYSSQRCCGWWLILVGVGAIAYAIYLLRPGRRSFMMFF